MNSYAPSIKTLMSFSKYGCKGTVIVGVPYIHMLSSGHIAEYLFCWCNLHRFSQQGWEHFNSLLKVFSFDERSMEAMLVTVRKLVSRSFKEQAAANCSLAAKMYSVDMQSR